MNEAETRAAAPDRVVLLDGPGANPAAGALLRRLGFALISATLRMYRGGPAQGQLGGCLWVDLSGVGVRCGAHLGWVVVIGGVHCAIPMA